MGLLRRLRGAIGNATVWGASWFASAAAFFGAVFALDGATILDGPTRLEIVLTIATNIGLTGFVTGLGFSAWLRLRHLDRPLLGIPVRWTAVAGATVSGALSVGLGWIVRASSGMPLTPADLLAGVPVVVALGAMTAGGTLYLAQRAERALTGREMAELEAEQDEVRALLGSHAG
jgi:hypothetical protein